MVSFEVGLSRARRGGTGCAFSVAAALLLLASASLDAQVCGGRDPARGPRITLAPVVATVEGTLTRTSAIASTVQLDYDATVVFSLCDDGGSAAFDSLLCLYDGRARPLAADDDSCGRGASRLQIQLEPGVYTIVVSASSTASGDFVLSYVGIPVASCSGRPADFASATLEPSVLPRTVDGSVTAETSRGFSVEVTQSGECVFSLCPDDGGSASYDAWMCLLDAEGELLTQNDDFCGLSSRIVRTLEVGSYSLLVSGFSTRAGDFTLAYRCAPDLACNGREAVVAEPVLAPSLAPQLVSGSVTASTSRAFAVDVTAEADCVFSLCEAGGTANYDTWMCLLDEDGTLIAQSDDSCGLFSRIARRLAPGRYYLAVSGFSTREGDFTLAYWCVESTTCNGRAVSLQPGGPLSPTTGVRTVSGSVTASTADGYVVEIPEAGEYAFSFCPEEATSSYDTFLCLTDAQGSVLAQNDDSCGLRSEIVRVLEPGAYLVAVSGFSTRAGDYTLAYFRVVEEPQGAYRACDGNCDGAVDIGDAVYVLANLFLGGPEPCCPEVANCNGVGGTDISDPVFLLNFLFLGGPPPAAPIAQCAASGCVEYERCP